MHVCSTVPGCVLPAVISTCPHQILVVKIMIFDLMFDLKYQIPSHVALKLYTFNSEPNAAKV